MSKDLFTCLGKGGCYEIIDIADPAGTAKDIGKIVTYRDVRTGKVYYRTYDDFYNRMEVWKWSEYK